MSDKQSFTSEEWAALREAPAMIALAVTIAGSSGLFGTIAETFGATAAMVEGMKSDSALVRALCAREELLAAQEAMKLKLQDVKAGDLATAQNRIRMTALGSLHRALDILEERALPDDLAAYRVLIHDIAQKVAHAAKEGSFLGFGGERVSEGERTMLAAITNALGKDPA
jgi:hypothetical protein